MEVCSISVISVFWEEVQFRPIRGIFCILETGRHAIFKVAEVVQQSRPIAPNSILMGLLNANAFAGPPFKILVGRSSTENRPIRQSRKKLGSNVESVIMYPPTPKQQGSNVERLIMYPQTRKKLGGNVESVIMNPPLPKKPGRNVESINVYPPLPKKLGSNAVSDIMDPQWRKKVGGNVESAIRYTQRLALGAKRGHLKQRTSRSAEGKQVGAIESITGFHDSIIW
jgi:hypothetical protein